MPKKLPEFQNFGEYLYYAYANLQMLHYALKDGKPRLWVSLDEKVVTRMENGKD